MPSEEQQRLLKETQLRLAQAEELDLISQLLQEHHYLGGIRPVGERLYRWLGSPSARLLPQARQAQAAAGAGVAPGGA